MIINSYRFGSIQIQLIDSDISAAADGANVTLNFTAAEDDVVIVFGGHRFRAGGSIGPTVGGWTAIATIVNSSLRHHGGVWYKRMTATPDTSVTCHGSSSSADAAGYGCYVLRGVHADVVDQTTTTAIATGANPDPASITTVTANAWVLTLVLDHLSANVPSGAPSGYSNLIGAAAVDTNSWAVGASTFEKTTAGVENAGAFTWSSNQWYCFSVAIKPG